MLHTKFFITIYTYSKGARGLSVQPQELRIFTENSISLSLCWRQQDSRYAIHAGHQLNAKEFRYLWTVRVTAAVYWELRLKPRLYSITLAAPGRRQFLYIFLQISRNLWFYYPVAVLDSVPAFKGCPLKATPYSEVTESFCRVPSTQLFQAP